MQRHNTNSTDELWKYDVYLSFRQADTGDNFTGHLRSNLHQRGFQVFRDDDELPRRREDNLPPRPFKGIEESRILLIVFSKNYASSPRCLDEVVKILESRDSQAGQQTVVPIFYKVDPSDVRNQTGRFAEAFNRYDEDVWRATEDDQRKKLLGTLQRWREALRDAANLAGWNLRDGPESEFIKNIVEDVSARIVNRTYLHVAKYQVGLASRVQDILEILDLGNGDVRMVGVWGPVGIGKTTIAKAVYNSVACRFEGSCFLANVREISMSPGGLVRLQNLLISDILRTEGSESLKVPNIDLGISMIKKGLRHKKVLLILDDVNDLSQLDSLVGNCDWFGPGSRIIIITRDRRLLTAHGIHPIYKVKKLDPVQALELFSCHAFNNSVDRMPDDCMQTAITASSYAQGLPLALVVFGAFMRHRSTDEWKAPLDRRFFNREIHDILKISFDALEESQKNVFLDIACFLNGKDKDSLIKIIEGYHYSPELTIGVLLDNALIEIDENRVWMTEVLEDMGKEIVRRESPNEPEKRSRLWSEEDVYGVLTQNTGTKKIRGIMIKFLEVIHLSAKNFSNMRSLKLVINCNPRISGDHLRRHLPSKCMFLDWSKQNVRRRRMLGMEWFKDILAEWIFLFINLCLESFSIAFDQAASKSKPQYALYGMVLAILAILISILEIIHKSKKEGVRWRKSGMLWWFCYPHPPHRRFGTLADFCGLLGGITQCVFLIIQYVSYRHHVDNPIKVSLWPAIFLICLGASRLSRKAEEHHHRI